MEQLLQVISTIITPSNALIEALAHVLKPQTVARKTQLLRAGQVCNQLWFINQGMARAYYFKEDKEITSWFMMDRDFIISVRSFFGQQRSYECIEVLETSELVFITYADLQWLYTAYPEFNQVGRVLTEQYYVQSDERLFQLRMNTAQERYNILLTSYPTIFQRTSLKQIASYLGLTPETLSRMRSKR